MATLQPLLAVTDTQMQQAHTRLGEFVAIPSLSDSTNTEYDRDALDQAAHFVKKEFEQLEFNAREVQVEDSPLYVVAERIHDVSLPTILFYAHYDVQPVDRDQWTSNPFVMKERNERLYGRGASDDKAGIIAISTALKALKDAGLETRYNIKILSEGEEEFGSTHMPAFLAQEKENLRADAMIILDGLNKNVDTGTVNNSLRGILQMAMHVDALAQPVHSGLGCIAPDPIMAMATYVSSLSDPRTIPGFMDECTLLNQAEGALLDQNSVTAEEHAAELGVLEGGTLRGDSTHSVYRRIVDEPSLTVTDFVSGETGGPGIVQNRSECTISVRLTPGQTADHVERCIRTHLKAQTVPGNLPFILERKVAATAWKSDVTQPYTQLFLEAMKTAYPAAGPMPCGGAIPLLGEFDKALPNMEKIVAGVEDPDTNAHSHNESQSKAVLQRTVDSLIHFLKP